jgi:hypothetical protein
MNEIATNAAPGLTNAVAAAVAAAPRETVFNGLDWLVILFFGIVMVVTVWFSMRKKNESGKDYFLSGRDANWLQIGSSIFSSNIGSEHLVGLAGAGFATGMAMAHWEMHAYWILVLGWAFVPLYDRMKVFTMPEFLELRFSRGSRNVLSLLTMASLVLTKIAATIYAGDVVIRTLLNVDQVHIPGLGVLGHCLGPGVHHRALYDFWWHARHHVHRRASGPGADLWFGLHPLYGTACSGTWQFDRWLARHGGHGWR